jgi:putative ABC transport system permease protein
MEDEMRFHLEMQIEQNLGAGMSSVEARQAARRQFGNQTWLKEVSRDMWSLRFIETLIQDLRYGARTLMKNPGFTVVAALTLALGIGANTAIFSVVECVLLKPLPYPQPEQLVTLNRSTPKFEYGSIPYPNFRDWQKENRSFSAIAIARGFGFNLIGAGEAERVNGQFISADFFSALGVKPLLGRSFAPGEDEIGAAPMILISESLWLRKFGSAPDTPGRALTLDDKSYTIVGVIPSSFKFFPNADVYAPIGQWNNPSLRLRSAGLGIQGIGRLKSGVTIEQAQADIDRVSRDLAAAYPDTNKGVGAKIAPLKERLIGGIRPTLLILLGAVGFVLLIACVNVSNLLLARSTGRTREFAIRAALGAGRWRLLRQSLTESMMLSLAGGGLGLLVASWGTKAALAAMPDTLPRAEEVGVDGRVLLFTMAISLGAGILSGLAPALKTSERLLSETLKEGARASRAGRVRAQGVFVAVEMALALVLLIGAGLMIRSLNALWNVDPGFRPDNALNFGLNLPPSMRTASPEAIRAALRELSDRLNSTPGVRAASFSWGGVPLLFSNEDFFWIDGQPKPSSQSEMNMAHQYIVDPRYLTAMGIPLKQGRFFTPQDDERSSRVVVIDEVLARKYFGVEDPIGKRIRQDGDENPWQIVGVVGHINQYGLDSDDTATIRAQLYFPLRAMPDNMMPRLAAGVNVMARVDGVGPGGFDSIRRVVQSHNSQNVIFRPQMMEEVIAGTLSVRRFSMTLLNAFAVAALLLASVGLYGVISYLVGQRTHELGVRIALGAGRRDVLRLVVNHGMKMALGGVALGILAALGLTRLLTEMLYGVSATDPATFTVITLSLIAVALAACFVPAWRATKVDPLVALKHE